MTEPRALAASRKNYKDSDYHLASKPLVSYIIATYSRGQILVERTIPSILEQTYPNIEVVVVGDRCVDDTEQLMQRYQDDPRVVFVNLQKRGNYPSDPIDRWFVQGTKPRNVGMRIAKGKWFAWLSDDDVILPNHAETLLKFATDVNAEFVSGACTIEVDGETNERQGTADCQLGIENPPDIGATITWFYRNYLQLFPWNRHAYRKSWNRPVDYDLIYRMITSGVKIAFVDEVVSHKPFVAGTQLRGFEAHKVVVEHER